LKYKIININKKTFLTGLHILYLSAGFPRV